LYLLISFYNKEILKKQQLNIHWTNTRTDVANLKGKLTTRHASVSNQCWMYIVNFILLSTFGLRLTTIFC